MKKILYLTVLVASFFCSNLYACETKLLNLNFVDLFIAVESGEIGETRTLLDEGVDVNFNLGTTGTPIHVAVGNGNLDMVKLLLDYKADPTICNSMGVSAMDLVGSNLPIQLLLSNAMNRIQAIETKKIKPSYDNVSNRTVVNNSVCNSSTLSTWQEETYNDNRNLCITKWFPFNFSASDNVENEKGKRKYDDL